MTILSYSWTRGHLFFGGFFSYYFILFLCFNFFFPTEHVREDKTFPNQGSR